MHFTKTGRVVKPPEKFDSADNKYYKSTKNLLRKKEKVNVESTQENTSLEVVTDSTLM